MYQSVLFVNVLSKDLSHLNIKVIITTSTILLEIIAKHLKFLYVSNNAYKVIHMTKVLDPSYLMGVSNLNYVIYINEYIYYIIFLCEYYYDLRNRFENYDLFQGLFLQISMLFY